MNRLLLLLFVPGVALAQESDDSIAGYWSGAYVRGSAVQVLELEIDDADGLDVRASIPERGFYRVPVRGAALSGDALTFRLSGRDHALIADSALGEIRGTAAEDGEAIDVHLKRTIAPIEPAIVIEDVRFESRGVTIAGSLVRPAASGPHPAFVIVAGRSYGSRWGYYSRALRLAQRGIIGLVFDGRGRGASGGDPATTTDEDRYQDVIGALAVLRSRDDVDRDRIGLWSESAGAWVVPEVARRDGHIAFLVMEVPPAESLAEQQGHVVEYAMRWFASDEFTEDDMREAYAYQKRLVELSSGGADWQTIAAHVATSEGKPWRGRVDVPESLENSEVDYFRRRPSYDPTEALRQTTIPVLALYGERDVVVPPPANVPRLEALLSEAGNDDVTIVVFPNADHGLDIPGEGDGWWRNAPGLEETIYGWIEDRVAR